MIDNASYRVLKTLYKINSIQETEIHKYTGHKDTNASAPVVSALLSNRLIRLEHGQTNINKGGNIFEDEATYKVLQRYWARYNGSSVTTRICDNLI